MGKLYIDAEPHKTDVMNNAFRGCLAGLASIVVATLLLFLVLESVVPELSSGLQQAIRFAIWLFGVAVGGYFAARRANNRSYRDSLNVGLLALLFTFARIPESPKGDFADAILALLEDPASSWRYLLAFALTVPAALLGGLVFQKTRRQSL